MLKLIRKLFNKGYLPYSPFKPSKGNKNALLDDHPKCEALRQALMTEMAKKLAENYYYLALPVKNLELKGEYNAITRIYDDLLNWFNSTSKAEPETIKDPVKKLMDEAEEKFKVKKPPEKEQKAGSYEDRVARENKELEEKFAKQKKKV